MQIHIGSRHLVADISIALDVKGREHLVVVAKSTWSIPAPGQRPRPLPPQPLAIADAFYGEPGTSALRYGSDFARFKPACDILFDACAHSPAGQPVRELAASWQVGSCQKSVHVVGPRRWRKSAGSFKLTDPEPFTTAALHYGLAFGGTRPYEEEEGGEVQQYAEAYEPNPVGIGYAGKQTLDQLHDAPAPQLEAPGERLRKPSGTPTPWAFSAVPSNCPPRSDHAGTYDEHWEQNLAPFLPEDFDERFHQCAPLDQQMPYPTGGEPVKLTHMLAAHPQIAFHLPPLNRVAVRVLRTDYSVDALDAVVDTLFFETEAQRFSAVWRCSTPLRRRIHEIDTITVGSVDAAWWRARRLGLEQEGDCVGCGDGPPEAIFEEETA